MLHFGRRQQLSLFSLLLALYVVVLIAILKRFHLSGTSERSSGDSRETAKNSNGKWHTCYAVFFNITTYYIN